MTEKKPTRRETLLQLIPGYVPGQPLPAPVPVAEDAKRTAQEARAAILPAKGAPPQEQGFMSFAPMPTDLCRVSPFFPMSRNEMASRAYIEDLIISKSAWGQITYSGPKLSTIEEDALMAVLAAINAMYDKETYTYEGPGLPLLKLMGYDKPAKNHYAILKKALKRMASSVFDMEIKGVTRTIENVITHFSVDPKNKYFKVVINPYFYEKYIAGNITLMDVIERQKLKKPTAKCLYRFMQSHRERTWQGHFLTLAAALNLETDKLPKHIKEQIKGAVAEMKRHGMLDKASGFVRGSADVVKLVRPGAAKTALK